MRLLSLTLLLLAWSAVAQPTNLPLPGTVGLVDRRELYYVTFPPAASTNPLQRTVYFTTDAPAAGMLTLPQKKPPYSTNIAVANITSKVLFEIPDEFLTTVIQGGGSSVPAQMLLFAEMNGGVLKFIPAGGVDRTWFKLGDNIEGTTTGTVDFDGKDIELVANQSASLKASGTARLYGSDTFVHGTNYVKVRARRFAVGPFNAEVDDDYIFRIETNGWTFAQNIASGSIHAITNSTSELKLVPRTSGPVAADVGVQGITLWNHNGVLTLSTSSDGISVIETTIP